MSVLCKTEEIIVDTNDYNSGDEAADESIQHEYLEDNPDLEGTVVPYSVTSLDNLTLEDSGGENYHSSYQTEQHHSTSPRQRNVISVARNLISTSTKNSSKSIMENEKRMRREIANSNERRRMQSINAGFQSLRSLLPHHEGEKLSKAAILQQTAQYIIELEREKTHLLTQNSQLKRLLGQHETGGGCGSGGGGGGGNDGSNGGAAAIKKRKLTDNVMTIQTISDSSDEGLGSMSPEPVTLLNNASKTGPYISSSTKEMNDLKKHLEAERKRRTIVEERLRQLERQIYPNQYIQREVIEHTDNIREEDIAVSIINDPLKLQVVEIDALPAVGQTQVVVCSSIEELQEEETETISEELIQTNVREEVVIPEESTEYVEVPSRLQPILEAAIKAEPKVEVERINATLTKIKTEPAVTKEGGKQGSRMYLTSTSRQNLETIVEAIRHLEGDHLFGDMSEQKKAQQKHTAQEVPLALTNKPQQRKLPVDLSPFLQLKNSGSNTVTIVGGGGSSKTNTALSLSAANSSSSNNSNNSSNSSNVKGTISNSSSSGCSNTTTNGGGSSINTVKTATFSTTAPVVAASPKISSTSAISVATQQQQQQSATAQVTIGSTSLKQCRPGVIVAKQIS